MSEDTRPNRRILVIDDNASIHEDFRKILCGATTGDSDLDSAEAALFGDDASSATSDGGFEVDFALQGQQGYEKLLEVAGAVSVVNPNLTVESPSASLSLSLPRNG